MCLTRHAQNRMRQKVKASEDEKRDYRIKLSEFAYNLPHYARAAVIFGRSPDKERPYYVGIIKSRSVITIYPCSMRKLELLANRNYIIGEI